MSVATILIWCAAGLAVPPVAARFGLRRLKSVDQAGWLTLIGISGCATALGVCLHAAAKQRGMDAGPGSPCLMLLVPLLATAGWVDHRTAWAPRELVAPICILSGLLSPAASDYGSPAGIAAGLLLFCGAHFLWRMQQCADAMIMPPADIVALLLPSLLFGLSWIAVSVHLALALLLLLEAHAGSGGRLRGNRYALAEAARDLTQARGAPVAFLGITAIPTAAGMVLQVLVGSAGTGG